jgi:hypothetical protein
MSKNKPAPRIDLEYNKDLKYPDINDYLKDSMYASNLSDYPDNQRNAVVNFRAIPNTLARKSITVGENKASLRVWVGDMKLFGYNPELELVDSMDLLIDSLNDGDTENVEGTKIFKIFKKSTNTSLNLDLVQNSEIQAFKLPALVNYSITFPIATVVEIYNYVFGIRAKQAKTYFTGAETLTDTEFQEAFLNNVYRWEVPALLRYYPVGSDKPDGFIGIEISLSSVLPQYRKKIELTSSSVEYNTNYSLSSFDLFKLSYAVNQEGRIRIKAQIRGFPATQREDSEEIELAERQRTSILSDFFAFDYIVYQHSGFYISYPALDFTYDLYVSADTVPELSNDAFGVFQASPSKIINNLTITSVKSGMRVLEKNADFNNPFFVSVSFSCKNKTLALQKNKLKFILSFRQHALNDGTKPDTSGFFNDVALDATVIAGDFWADTAKSRNITVQKSLRTSSVLYRSNALNVSEKKVLSVFQRLTPNNDKYLSSALSNCSVDLTLTNANADTNTYFYRIDISWPINIDKTVLYNLIKARFVQLSISDIFQQVILDGRYRRPFYDIYEDNLKNPLFTSLPGWRANYYTWFTNSWTGLGGDETAAINKIPITSANGSFSVQQSNSKLQTINITGRDVTNITLLEYTPLTYIALSTTEPADTKPSRAFFCLQGMAMAASRSIRNGKLQALTAFPQFAKPLTNLRGEFNVINPVTFDQSTGRIKVTISPQDVIRAIKKIVGTVSLTKGVYYMYYIMNLNEVPDSESRVFTNLMDGNKQKSTLIFVVVLPVA